MRHFERRVIQTPKITKLGIILNIIFIILPIVAISLVWEHMDESAFKEMVKIFFAIIDAICILYLVHRLVLNKTWFDVDDPGYKAEYIKLYDDHIKIYNRAQTYEGHYYTYAKIYFEDIKFTFINGKNLKNVYKMKILLKRNKSNKSIIIENGEIRDRTSDMLFVYMSGFPEELYIFIFKTFF